MPPWPCLVLVCVAVSASAQTADVDAPVFSVDVPLVNLTFSVQDRGGRLIRDLKQEDIEIYEDGVAQRIQHFRREFELPLTLGVLIDRSPSQSGFEGENIFVAQAFFQRILREDDRVFLAAFGDQIREIQAFTNSAGLLEKTLRRMPKLYGRSPWLGPRVRRRGGSAVIDATYWATYHRLRAVEGRKALIMIGDGRDSSSSLPVADTIELMQMHDVLFYGLDNAGRVSKFDLKYPNRMPRIAEETGGRILATSESTLEQAFSGIEEDLRSLYGVGYVSSNSARDGRFRRVKVRVLGRDFQVRTRPGYVAR